MVVGEGTEPAFAPKYFRVLGQVGEGATARVLIADRTGPGESGRVALKVLRASLTDQLDVWRAFVDEARLLSAVNDGHVVRIFDLLERDGIPFLVLEPIDGPNLMAALRLAAKRQVPLRAEVCVHVIAGVARALHAIHEAKAPDNITPLHIVHRDVSPHNVLVDRAGRVVLIDFGVAKSVVGRRSGLLFAEDTAPGVLRGRISFAAPEQRSGSAVDGRADLFALGKTAECLLAQGELGTIASAFATFSGQLTSVDREKRTDSAAEVVQLASALCDQLGGEQRCEQETARFVQALGLPSLLG